MGGFFAGTLYTLHTGLGNCSSSSTTGVLDAKVESLAQQRLKELQDSLPDCKELPAHKKEQTDLNTSTSGLKFPTTTSNYAVGMARTSKTDFVRLIDTGVPVDLPKENDADVLVLYGKDTALPKTYNEEKEHATTSSIPALETEQALEGCEFLNIVLTDHSKQRNQCIAIVPQYESYHVQKWMRQTQQEGEHGVDHNAPLVPVSRGVQTNGREKFKPPLTKDIQQNWELLSKYFQSYHASLEELKPLVEKVATPKKTVTVMVCNFGQSMLLMNFVCAARSRNLDTSSILVFATDLETKALAESLGLTAFYDERNFGEMPSEAAGHYGDRKFTAMMMAKVICVQMVSALQYNVLFQDVDIVWYRDPIEFFETTHQHFDILFQDDGGHTVRYAPYSANSGFYYVRYNARTEYFFSSLLLAGDLILKTDSHQQALIALLSEHVSLYGLRAKVFSRDEEEFPGGYQYHQHSGAYMRKLFAGDVHPFIFHMSWTLNKDNKLLFFRQMGEWYVQEQCIHKKVEEISLIGEEDQHGDGASHSLAAIPTCCSAEPLLSCHYRDKPSKIPCKDSPPIDKGRPSFW